MTFSHTKEQKCDIRQIVIGYLLFALLAGCAPPASSVSTGTVPSTKDESVSPTPVRQTPTAKPTPEEDDWYKVWLQGKSCKAPCFEGVTPGQTTLQEALAAWQNSPLIQSITVYTNAHPTDTSGGDVVWDWVGGSGSGDAVFNKADPPVITSIRATYGRTFTLGEAIRAFGEPSHIDITVITSEDGSKYYVILIVFLNQGIVIERSLRYLYKPELNDETEFNRVTFFVPTESGFDESRGRTGALMLLKRWVGMRDLVFYCTDDEGGKLCREP